MELYGGLKLAICRVLHHYLLCPSWDIITAQGTHEPEILFLLNDNSTNSGVICYG